MQRRVAELEAQLEVQQHQHETQITILEQQIDALRSSLQVCKDSYSSNYQQRARAIAEIVRQVDELSDICQSSNKAVDAARRMAQDRADKCHGDLQTCAQDRSECRTLVAKLEKQVKQAKGKSVDSEVLEDLRLERDELTNQVLTLDKQLRDANATITKLTKANADLQQAYSGAEEAIIDCNEKLFKRQRRGADSVTIDSLRATVSKMEKSLDSAQSKLRDCRGARRHRRVPTALKSS